MFYKSQKKNNTSPRASDLSKENTIAAPPMTDIIKNQTLKKNSCCPLTNELLNSTLYFKRNKTGVRKLSYYMYEKKLEAAMYYCNYTENARVCEIGCNIGYMTYYLSKQFKNLTAIDNSPLSIEIAQKRLTYYGCTNIKFITDTIDNISTIPDASFDLIFSFSALGFYSHPKEILKQIYKKLVPHGIAIIEFPNKILHLNWLNFWLPRSASYKKISTFSKNELHELFMSAGFQNVSSKYFLFTPVFVPNLILPMCKQLDKILETIPLIRRFSQNIMVQGIKSEPR